MAVKLYNDMLLLVVVGSDQMLQELNYKKSMSTEIKHQDRTYLSTVVGIFH